MSELPEIPPPPSPSEAIARLEDAQSASSWLAWGGLGIAFLWWVAAFVGTIAVVGTDTLGQLQPALIVAGIIAIVLPGLMLVLAGMLAREQARSTAANALVLESAAKLLMPTESMANEAKTFATEMAKASAEVDRSMGHALSAMKAMAGEIGDERQRLESVTYASADNARDLAERLGNERNGLEQLAKELREQTELLNEAIPEQANLMIASAQAAATEVSAAEGALHERLNALDETGRGLVQKVSAMDALAAQAEERSETLLFAIARMEEKLEHSRKTVETAARAGELAAAAAGTTGDRLTEAVNVALDSAREASNQIQKQTFEASESAARSLAELKQAGQQAAAAVRAAGMAARAEIDISERRASNTSQALLERSKSIESRFTEPVETNIEQPTRPLPDETPEPTYTSAASPSESIGIDPKSVIKSPSRAVEEDLFEASADRMAKAVLNDAGEAIKLGRPKARGLFAPRNDDQRDQVESNGIEHDANAHESDTDLFVADTNSGYEAEPAAPNGIGQNGHTDVSLTPRTQPIAQSPAGDSLSDIIADMERDERSSLSREETAEALLNQLQESGVRLTDIFRPKDKKKIAIAARKGEDHRRSAINQQVGRQVERVRARLRGNLEMMTLARDFLALEETDALNALENTHASNKNASARLATYLLLDAAVT